MDESVFCAGQIALVPCTMQLLKAGVTTQARLCFSHVKKVLEAVISGLTLAHVVQAHCYTTRHQDIPIVRAAWKNVLKAAEEEQVSLYGVVFSVCQVYASVLSGEANCFIIDAEEILIILIA